MQQAMQNLPGSLTNQPFVLPILLCFLFLSPPAYAEAIEAILPNGITASANFNKGLASRPAVLFLHGFLQTHQSQPLNSLASNLASKGYTTLNPTISLGINKRSQSMACEAVHTHTMTEDIAEVAFWVNWLMQKGHKNVALIGFSSTGNSEIILYNAQASHPAVKKAILISMNPILTNHADFKKARDAINAKLPANKFQLMSFSLGYCKNNFFTTAVNYLSYAQHSEQEMLALITTTPVETEFIFGSLDTILPFNWPGKIKALKTQPRVVVIENANHFFEDTFEFDLAEIVENSLKNIPAQ